MPPSTPPLLRSKDSSSGGSTEQPTSRPPAPTGKRLLWLSLGALGVVYGDIGTSPLYALKECLSPERGIGLSTAAVLGILSLMC